MWEWSMSCEIFLKTERDRAKSGVNWEKILKKHYQKEMLPISLMELVKYSMQYVTHIRCPTPTTKLGKSGVLLEN